MANCVSFKAVALLALVGAVVLFCDAKPPKKSTYTPSAVAKVGSQLQGKRSYDYTIKVSNNDPDSVAKIFREKGITYIEKRRTRKSVEVNISDRDHQTFKELKAGQERIKAWTVTSEKSKKKN